MINRGLYKDKWSHIKSGETIEVLEGVFLTAPEAPGYYQLAEALNSDSTHQAWIWERELHVLENWIKIPIPEECKEIAVFCDWRNYEREVKKGMKPLLEDNFMPVLIAYESKHQTQTDPEMEEDHLEG